MKFSKLSGLFLAMLSLAICSPLAYGDPPAPTETDLVENPYYDNWAAFAVGSTKTVREVTVSADGVKTKERTSTLKEVTEDRIILESVTTELHDVAETIDAPQTVVIPAKISKEAFAHMEFLSQKKEGAPESPNSTSGKETLEIGGEKLECEWIASTWEHGGVTHTSKVWLSKEVPGHLVKWSRGTKSQDHSTSHDSVLISFIAKPAK